MNRRDMLKALMALPVVGLAVEAIAEKAAPPKEAPPPRSSAEVLIDDTFLQGDVVYWDGANWRKADAAAMGAGNCSLLGIVSDRPGYNQQVRWHGRFYVPIRTL